ncbi:hypothetical protein BUALT_Bualt05G0096400 [Buddleja alternifolia]|uniref:Uncharacterized protein n=1 Tax=Buddleja alternifolia TaxID=168488 RepID=A0AAV6XUE3_9LAMI|nr:hypothetical protein BUALT_Bualt05G0096400 [Buddleja alternifolia]
MLISVANLKIRDRIIRRKVIANPKLKFISELLRDKKYECHVMNFRLHGYRYGETDTTRYSLVKWANFCNSVVALCNPRFKYPSSGQRLGAAGAVPLLRKFALSQRPQWMRALQEEILILWFDSFYNENSGPRRIITLNILEYRCYINLRVKMSKKDFLKKVNLKIFLYYIVIAFDFPLLILKDSDNGVKFRRLTFDMMLAWEDPGIDNNLQEGVDDKKTVGPEAFARIAPACPLIADMITVRNLFDVLTSASGSQLHFLTYDKYLRSLEKVMKSVQNAVGPQLISNLSLAEDEIIMDIDGIVPTQPVLQHIGMSAWPGRLTLTNYALYFESGIARYDKAVRYDLATDMKQVIKPELTGPLGARLYDKAVMYKSISMAEPVYLEFPEFKGCTRRDYWLDICLEICRAHKFVRKYNMKGNQQSEALARAILGILRYRAVKEAFRISSSNYKTLLCFNLAESLPGGDMIIETLSTRLTLVSANPVQPDVLSSTNEKRQQIFPVALLTLRRLGIVSSGEVNMDGEATFQGGDVWVGESNPLEALVKQLKQDTTKAEAAQATEAQVKMEGIDTNLAVMKELLFPLFGTFTWLVHVASWEDPTKSVIFVVISTYMILRDWIKFMLPSIFVYLALVMLWRRRAKNRKQLEALKIIVTPSKNTVEQLLILQDAINQAESLIQAVNIVLLKIRALLFAGAPQATDKLIVLFILMAVAFAILPMKVVVLSVFVEHFTSNMPLRKESSIKSLRRLREWWTRIPAAPVELIKPDDKKAK